jgi:deoxyribose-phosphate aldolase
MGRTELNKRLQYTNVLANATRREIERHCELAGEYSFHAVMLQPCWVPLAKAILRGTDVRVATAVAYPLGGETVAMKTALVREVIRLGAEEIDFQPNIGFLRSGMFAEFAAEIRAIVEAADGRPVKSMSEFGYLNDDERIRCVRIAEESGAAYVKNSSGVGPGGSAATPEVIRFIKRHLNGYAGVKASGQIRDYSQALALVEAGADLLGSSAAPAIVNGQAARAVAY